MSTLAIGQLIVFGFEEPTLDEVSCELLKKRQAGGVILFKRNIVSLEQNCGSQLKCDSGMCIFFTPIHLRGSRGWQSATLKRHLHLRTQHACDW